MNTNNDTIKNIAPFKWWLIFVPFILWIFSRLLGFVSLIIVGYTLYKQYQKRKLFNEFVQDVEQGLKNGTLSVGYWNFDEFPLNNQQFALYICNNVQRWGEEKLSELKTFNEVFDDEYVSDYIHAATCCENISKRSNDSQVLTDFYHRAENLLAEYKLEIVEKIEKAKYAKDLSDVLTEISGHSSFFICYSDYEPFKKRIIKLTEERLAIMSESELGIPYQIKCDYVDYDSEENIQNEEDLFDDFETQYESGITKDDVEVRISKDSIIINGENINKEIDYVQIINYVESDESIEFAIKSGRQRFDFELKNFEAIVPAWLINKFTRESIENLEEIRNSQSKFELMTVDAPVVLGRKCYYVCEALYVRKVVDDGEDLSCVGKEEEATIYVTERTIEIVATSSHVSLDLRNILNMQLNAYEDILMIVRRGYSSALGLSGDVVILERAIRHAQQRLMNN